MPRLHQGSRFTSFLRAETRDRHPSHDAREEGGQAHPDRDAVEDSRKTLAFFLRGYFAESVKKGGDKSDTDRSLDSRGLSETCLLSRVSPRR
jgi:hypothetical protein